jgi:hypothetical protein
MKSMPQHACESCNELVSQIGGIKSRVAEVKRLGTLTEMQTALSALQMELYTLQQKAVEVKQFVFVAFVTTRARECSDVVPMFPERCERTQELATR